MTLKSEEHISMYY